PTRPSSPTFRRSATPPSRPAACSPPRTISEDTPMTKILRGAAIAALALAATPAFAHPGHGTDGVLHGFAHPIGGLDPLLAMVAVGVFAYVLGGRALWLVPAAFVSMMVVGFALGMGGVPLPGVELGIALSSIVIGGAAAFGRSIPVAIAMGLVGVFAIF